MTPTIMSPFCGHSRYEDMDMNNDNRIQPKGLLSLCLGMVIIVVNKNNPFTPRVGTGKSSLLDRPLMAVRAYTVSLCLFVVIAMSVKAQESNLEKMIDSDVVVVGSGISGLCTALEAGRAGASVTVIDMWSVFGGHAVMSTGMLCLVDTPVQQTAGILDSPELAAHDFLTHGEDADADWVQLYTKDSRSRVYDWLIENGVKIESLFPSTIAGNSVRRQHLVTNRGAGLVIPLYRQCLELPNLRFVWNTKVLSLIQEGGRIGGVRTLDVRTGNQGEYRGRAVVLATGGFQNNLDLVRQHWPELPDEARVLRGAGVNAVGSGLEMARREGARVERLDHQWNYSSGMLRPEEPGGDKGLGVWVVRGIEVNSKGQRFVNEWAGPKITTPALIRQPNGIKYAIFGAEAVPNILVAGTGWDNPKRIQQEILDNPAMSAYVKKASSIADLGSELGMDPADLVETVNKWNGFVETGEDAEFGRTKYLSKIETPPFYSIQLFLMTRKSFGGVAVNLNCQVLDLEGAVIPGLYAVGELTGFGGINGRAGLEGTMLGPSILMGRIAGGGIARELNRSPQSTIKVQKIPGPASPNGTTPQVLLTQMRDWLRQNIETREKGFDHFKKAHTEVLKRGYDCRKCHIEQALPMALSAQLLDRGALTASCVTCHSAQE